MKPDHLIFKKMYGSISVQLSLHWILEMIDFENIIFLEVCKDEVIFRESATWKIEYLCRDGKKIL